jgi:hypothetical protein
VSVRRAIHVAALVHACAAVAWSQPAAHRTYINPLHRFAYEGSSLELRALNVGEAYWIAIEAFDESGVSKLSTAVHLP